MTVLFLHAYVFLLKLSQFSPTKTNIFTDSQPLLVGGFNPLEKY